MFAPHSLATILTLAAAVALGPLSTDMYLPALPRMTDGLNTTVDQMQLTLSVQPSWWTARSATSRRVLMSTG